MRMTPTYPRSKGIPSMAVTQIVHTRALRRRTATPLGVPVPRGDGQRGDHQAHDQDGDEHAEADEQVDLRRLDGGA
jgi:hypothetical protein